MEYIIDLVILFVIYICFLYPKWKNQSTCFINTLFYLYLCSVIAVTLMPICLSLPTIFSHEYHPMNIIPFDDVIHGWGDYERQIILNILMFVPFGFLCPIVIKKRFFSVVLGCMLVSLAIELIQPLLSIYRFSDITDVITNTIGGILGYLFYYGISKTTLLDKLIMQNKY
ncbi:MAG: VanZ family protein [Traorella sp.]